MNKTRFPIFTAAALALLPMGLSAQTTIAWDAAVPTGDFTTDSNWIGGAAPANDLTTNTAQLTGGTVTLDVDRSVYGLDTNVASTLTGAGTRLTLGSGGLTGTSDLTLGGSVILRTGTVTTYAGAVTIDGATVESATGTQGFLGTGAITLDNGGTIADTGSNLNMRDTTSITLGAGGGTFRNANKKAFYGMENALITGAGQLTLDGAGSTNYSGNSRIQMQSSQLNTYSGGTLITNKANVQINGDRNFGAVTGKVTIDDARMVTDANVTFDAAREFEIGSGGGRISLNNKTSTINGILSGSGALTVDGQIRDDDGGSPGGTLTLTADSTATFTGDITVGNNTTLRADQNSIALDSGAANITLDGGTLSSWDNRHMDIGGRQIILTENGGTVRHGGGRNMYGSTKITGVGHLTIKGDNGDGGRFQMTGVDSDYSGGTTVTEGGQAWAYYGDSFGTGAVTLDNGDIQLVNNDHTFANDIAIVNAGNDIKGNRSGTFSGVLSGSGTLNMQSSSTISFSNANNTFSGILGLGTSTGTLNLTSLGEGATITGDGTGTLNFLGDISLDAANSYAGVVNVLSGASVGGDGSLAGALVFETGAIFNFVAGETLTVAGDVSFGTGFGVDDIAGLSSATEAAVYTLIDGTSTDFALAGLDNWGSENAYDLGDDMIAYFQSGSLQLVVEAVPEPSSFALIAGALALGSVMTRRRRS